ncbi:hypothetical protein [Rufibacter ruber]|uniref:hypothetical protein n=1 Tax=Rufibacter ruber TaxID=1783499 RepID=UPI00083773B9|nr:hypothetical protein [Rufibacter ruber]
MKIIKPNMAVAELEPAMQDVMVLTGGYVTNEFPLPCRTLEKFASSANLVQIDFYLNEANQIITFHYGYRLSLDRTIRAIDCFTDFTTDQVNKILQILLGEIRSH